MYFKNHPDSFPHQLQVSGGFEC